MEPCIRVGIDVDCKAHRVGIAAPDGDGTLLDEFNISHTQDGFGDFFRRVRRQEEQLSLPVAVAMEGFNGYARPLDREIRIPGWRLYSPSSPP